jgi:hypothetical protein
MMRNILARALFAGLFIVAPALAVDYQANLGPMPLDDESKTVIAGRGDDHRQLGRQDA